jgi:hypothetical protein
MHTTQHVMQRMGQRGISRDMIDLVLEYGEIDQDKRVLGRKHAQRLLKILERQIRVTKKILDKGGVVVVDSGTALITTYNYKSDD